MLLAGASSAICVQRFDDSRNSAIHTTYRISLRSSSLHEPRYPLLRVVLLKTTGCASRQTTLYEFGLVCRLANQAAGQSQRGPDQQPGGTNRFTFVFFDRFNDPSAGSPTETLLRLLLPLGGRV